MSEPVFPNVIRQMAGARKIDALDALDLLKAYYEDIKAVRAEDARGTRDAVEEARVLCREI